MAPRTARKAARKAPPKGNPPRDRAGGAPSAARAAAAKPLPKDVVVRRTAEIDARDPLASGASAPLRKIWIEAAREARDSRRVVIDLVGEGRGIVAIPVVFESEHEALRVMTPALDALVTHCAGAGRPGERPVMVDLQELRERLHVEPEEDWIAEHAWLHGALAARELLCMYVFSASYLLEFAEAIAKKQGFALTVSKRDPGFYDLRRAGGGDDGLIVWNWARAIGDVIAGGHSWSYFGMLLALAPTVAEQQRRKGEGAPAPHSEDE